jgi:branched-chain amino acid transport system ATP-binding protein
MPEQGERSRPSQPMSAEAAGVTAVLEARNLSAGYGGTAMVRNLNLHVLPGEVVALFGPNGAGKTTTLLALAGELTPLTGQVFLQGQATSAPLHQRARCGLALVTEERSVFAGLTVEENLRLGRGDPREALRLFPELAPLRGRRAGLLSGGEQQILTLARAIAGRPSVLLIDELSLGLAPMVVDRLMISLRQAADTGVGVLLVEQQVEAALSIADRGYVMKSGEILFAQTTVALRADLDQLESAYLTELDIGTSERPGQGR